MKHALLVEVPDWDELGRSVPVASAATMGALLEELGGWTIVECKGSAATREGVLAALEHMLGTCGPNDTCLFHFFGHGSMARFAELEPELGDRPVAYLATLRPPGAPRVGVCDFEISAALTRLDAICENVTAILDCCQSGSMVRSAAIDEPPTWVSALAARLRADGGLRPGLAAESHPRIVRLAGASSLRTAFARVGPAGKCGLLTHAFVDLVREAGLRCDRLTWDAVAHRIREAASREGGAEEQRVVLSGPRHRLVFSTTTVELPRSAAFVPRDHAEGVMAGGPHGRVRGWLRAGSLQGVQVGDRWSLAALTLDDALAPRFIADLEIERVELDLAEVTVVADAPVSLPVGASAMLRELGQRLAVAVDEPTGVAEAIAASGWLQRVPAATPGVARVMVQAAAPGHPVGLELLDAAGRASWHTAAADPACALVELLEDRARAARLLAALEASGRWLEHETPLRLRWGTIGPDERRLPGPSEARPRVHVGDRLWLELVHEGDTPPHWFASVIELGADGRPRLLNGREPDGLELAPRGRVCIGVRGQRGPEGLRLVWPTGVPAAGPRSIALLVLASRRPLSLASLVRIADPEDDAAFVAQGLRPPPLLGGRTRGGPERGGIARGGGSPAPVGSTAWTWARVELELHPSPRSTAPTLPPPSPASSSSGLTLVSPAVR